MPFRETVGHLFERPPACPAPGQKICNYLSILGIQVDTRMGGRRGQNDYLLLRPGDCHTASATWMIRVASNGLEAGVRSSARLIARAK